MFLNAEYAETVVIAGIVTAIFLGGYHLPWLEPTIARTTEGWLGASGIAWRRLPGLLVLRRFLAACSGERGRGKPFLHRGGALTWTNHTTSARAPDRRPT